MLLLFTLANGGDRPDERVWPVLEVSVRRGSRTSADFRAMAGEVEKRISIRDLTALRLDRSGFLPEFVRTNPDRVYPQRFHCGSHYLLSCSAKQNIPLGLMLERL
jgi:hypothetical protein